ncbi:TraR/DksA family transcriptional regulator [Paucihalobacter sp.]|uniref:TraR/DksA family transcriptional regulator n=1 Tax=Paucihalobacter sp. TaxID=2850405 RepID=UPI002FE0E0F5
MDTSNIKEIIAQEIEKTEAQIKSYQELTKPVAPDAAIGRVSRIDHINNKSVIESALQQAEEKLRKLNNALSNVESPDFGMCLKCKQQIPLGRILIRPESAYCVQCAT